MHKKPQTSSEDTCEAGIDIEQAKKNMAEEDKFDKQLYRDKIRQKHKVRHLLADTCTTGSVQFICHLFIDCDRTHGCDG